MADPLSALLDEVCLEGLDGVTVETLWLRLSTRRPAFPLHLDTRVRQYLWSALTCNPHITFYLLPRERAPVQVYDRFMDIDPETGIQELRQVNCDQTDDPYVVSVVVDDPHGVQGSCLYYRERKDITHLLRSSADSPGLSLEETQTRFGEKLVIVAPQDLRYRALIGDEGNPEMKLNDYSYCILERLGRARWQGEVQRDLHILAFKIDAGKLHYLRKPLDRNGLITMQSHVIQLPTGVRQHSILLLLKRFHIDRRSKYDILMESTSNLLSKLPNKIGIVLKLREQLRVGEHTFKRVYQYMQAAKLVSVVTVPLQNLNPEAGPCKTRKGKDIKVRCLKLLKPYSRKVIDDDDDDENNEEEGDSPVKKSVQAQSHDIERDLLSQAYEIVVATGCKGISQSALRVQLNVGRLEGRMICRILEKNNMIKGFMEDVGRQRTTKYISKVFVEKSKLNLQFTKERERSELLRVPQQDQDDPLGLDPETEDQDVARAEKSKSKAQKKTSPAQTVSPAAPRHSTPVRKTDKSVQEVEPTVREENDSSLLKQEDATTDHTPSFVLNQSENLEDTVTVVEDIVTKSKMSLKKSAHALHQTYRLLKRKNIIIEAVRHLKVIEGLFTLQKKLMDEEKQDGVNTKVCKKSILRLIRALAKDGFLKLFRTTVIQDGVSKKVEFIVHPSITPDDPMVKSAIEQVRFKISSSYTVHRLKKEEEKAKALSQEATAHGQDIGSKRSNKTEDKMGFTELKEFKPTIVPGLSRTLGFQPKMPRFRVVHTFLFYLIYEYPLSQSQSNDPTVTSEPNLTTADPTVTSEPNLTTDDPTLTSDPEVPPNASTDITEKAGKPSVPPTEDEQFRVYANEQSWKRFVPPLPVHRGFGSGWALTSDILISLPLSIYVQVIQINYKVDGLEEFLNDPIKQHYLVRFLPSSIKTQLLHRRKYFFSFFENLQKLSYMGLLQFRPVEKFMDKDQCFFYLKKRATIVDTTVCEPHYNLAIETRPFDRRRYTFNTLQDVDNYWFDLLCVCLNTPLGVIRPRARQSDGDGGSDEPDVPVGHERYDRLQDTLKGSCDVVDDGVTPGDGQGAGGLDSLFFSHLKRNWLWTTHLLNRTKKTGVSHAVRLRNLLSKHFTRSGLAATQSSLDGGNLAPPAVLEEEVQMDVEPSSRNQQVRGGKKLKRKRQKKEGGRPAKRRKKVDTVRKQTACQDEIDRKALLRMTRQRVTWTHLEDSILMLCRVASHFLNRKIRKPFVAWNVVRDILHAELELSLDKTSLSVGRRSRYIMKNPQTQLNYRICLAEVYQDKTLIEEFMNRTNNYDDLKVCAEEFKEFVAALRMKFSSSCGANNVIIPDTKEELFNKFKVYVIGEEAVQRTVDVISRVEDIQSLVLNNLIQSTLVLSNSQMKTCQSFQSFSLYSRYKSEVLLQAFQNCKKRGLVNRRRANKVLGPKKSRAVPFVPMSYQLSQQYYKFFTWRFPSTLCNEVYDLLEILRQKGGVDQPNKFSFQDEEVTRKDKNGEITEGSDKQSQDKGDGKGQTEKDEGPDPAVKEPEDAAVGPRVPPGVMEDSRVPPVDGDTTLNTLAPPGDEEVSVLEHLPPVDVKDAGEDRVPPPDDLEDMLNFPIDAPGGSSLCCLSLMSLGLLTVDISIPQQVVVVDSTLVDNEVVKSITKELDEDEDDDGEDEKRGRVEVKARQASHTNYLLMKGYFVPGIISLRNINSSEHIAVNSCTVRIRLRHTPAHTLFRESDGALSVVTCSSVPSVPAQFCRVFKKRAGVCGQSFADKCVCVLGYGEADLEAILALRAAVLKEAEFGVDRLELSRRFSHLEHLEPGRSRTLQQYIQDLIDAEELLEVGALSYRLVNAEYGAPWLLQCPIQVCEEVCQALSIPESMKHRLALPSPQRGDPGPPPPKRPRNIMESATVATDSVESSVKETVTPGTVTHGSITMETIATTETDVPRIVAVESSVVNPTVTVPNEPASVTIIPSTTAAVTMVNSVATEIVVPENVTMETSASEEEVSRTKSSKESSTSDKTDSGLCGDASALGKTDQDGEDSKGSEQEEEPWSFVARPWRIVDGSLNRPVCKGMLEAVLLHIMTNPGLPESALIHHYCGVLQPVVVLDLLQVLIELGCVRKRFTLNRSKASLFSRPSAAEVRDLGGDSTTDSSVAFYEPTVDSSLRLAQLFPHETNWNKWVQLSLR